MGVEGQGWQGFSHYDWNDLAAVRARLDAGADPDGGMSWSTPLHAAAAFGTAEVVAEVVARVADVDHVFDDRTALWRAVHGRRPDAVRVLLAAGADPVRPMMSGWSPARLSLTTPHPITSAEVLTRPEWETAAECGRLIAALQGLPPHDGYSLACVAGVDAAEALRRLNAEPMPAQEALEMLAEDESEFVAGVTDVPGGCVVMQPQYYNASSADVLDALSAGTVAYGMYANPKSGNQGSIHRDGATVDWDLHPGGAPGDRGDTAEVLLEHLCAGHAVAYCCAYAGLRPKDAKAFTEPDQWFYLHDLSFWSA
ncbi:ankyrin repeat domain-containing protein [Lentzea sp. NPDC058450]|uniref:ankyrin repeat domain-containing protein n=1 Tax=Lentzea sp. NPDC058450 TaxID=3346505 RepID=UPI00365147F1